MKIAIIGCGVLGQAMLKTLAGRHGLEIIRIDKDKMKCLSDGVMVSQEQLDAFCPSYNDLADAQIAFLCLPTPTKESGEQDLSAITEVLGELDKISYRGLVVIRSTILPGTTNRLQRNRRLRLCHNPEFLTEQNAVNDFKHARVALIGGEGTALLRDFYFANTNVDRVLRTSNPTNTEMAKYMHNLMLAAKVSLANEFQMACSVNCDADYEDVKGMVVAMGKVGDTHLEVPGIDGKYGFGGMCFPKDLKAWNYWVNSKGPPRTGAMVLETVERRNLETRKQYGE